VLCVGLRAGLLLHEMALRATSSAAAISFQVPVYSSVGP
jgi:hypothetical protein